MARLIYTLLFYSLLPLIILRLLWRSRRAPRYRKRWGERFGFVKESFTGQKIIWLHSVSVGETLAAVPLVKAIQTRYPQHRLLVTTMTPTGSERVKAAFGDSVSHNYAPYDLPDALARFLGRVRPELLIIMETELWPNTIAACHKRGVPVVLANARLSEKSARGYRQLHWITSLMLQQLQCVAAQHRDDARRFQELGLNSDRITITGNIKFDLALGEELKLQSQQLAEQWRGDRQRPILLAASTHQGEDEMILNAFGVLKKDLPELLLVLVPRHPERFNEVAGLCISQGFTVARRSDIHAEVSQMDILLGDTMGELMMFFGACDVAFVGGSLVPTGGHNVIEPAAWGKPIVTGPHLFNFAEASRLLQDNQAMLVCSDAEQLAEQIARLFQESDTRKQMGQAARQVAEANRGALDRLLAVIAQMLC